jgi:hypothetical protein
MLQIRINFECKECTYERASKKRGPNQNGQPPTAQPLCQQFDYPPPLQDTNLQPGYQPQLTPSQQSYSPLPIPIAVLYNITHKDISNLQVPQQDTLQYIPPIILNKDSHCNLSNMDSLQQNGSIYLPPLVQVQNQKPASSAVTLPNITDDEIQQILIDNYFLVMYLFGVVSIFI